MPELRAFPSSFLLKNICSITSRGFELKSNPDVSQVDQAVRQWFKKFNVYDEARRLEFLTLGRFDLFAALSFPEADAKHLETCLAFFFWAFSTDDLSDEGELMTRPDDVQAGHNISMKMLENPDGPAPKYPYAAMLHDLLQRIKATATPGTYARFIRAFEAWSQSKLPSVSEFILMKEPRLAPPWLRVPMVEYSLDIKIPDYVGNRCILQMIDDRVSELHRAEVLPTSFGAEVDAELAKYHKALEYFSPLTSLKRIFRG
ncbi:hypothetical protein BDQ17DRAFT_1370497 [Cyathus striatus]|nr:hypothetical protein BDQ17DRAFT_1370497 [Cyathus striatus]